MLSTRMEKLIRKLLGESEGDLPSLSPKELLILRMLVTKTRFGQELVNESDGQLKRGTVYVTLQRMEEKGLIESTQEERPAHEGGLPRRRYKITGEGQRALDTFEKVKMMFNGGRLA